MATKGRTKKQPFPAIKKKNEGKFTSWVEKNMPGKSTCSAASAVMKNTCLLYTSPSPRDRTRSRMPSSA